MNSKIILILCSCIIVGLLSSLFPILQLTVILSTFAVAGVFMFPVLGIVLLAFSGRFNKIPFVIEFNGPIYVGIFIIILLGLVFLVTKKKGITLPNRKYLLLSFLFLVALFIGNFVNPGSEYGITKSLEFLVYTFPLILFTVIFINKKEKVWLFIMAIIGTAFTFAILGLLTGELGSGRLSVLGGGSNVYGRYMVYGLTGILPFFHVTKSRLLKVSYLGLITLFIVMAYFTGSRQALLGIFVCLFFYITLYLLKVNINSKIRILIKISLLFVVLILYFPGLIQSGISNSTTWNRLMLLLEDDKGDSVLSRMEMIDYSWRMFMEKPILGWGTGSFADQYSYVMRYPHNLVLEIFSELGTLGILIFALTGILIISSSYKSFKQTSTLKDVSLVITIINYLLVSLFFSLISGDLFDSRWIWLFGTVIAALPYIYKNHSVGDRYEKNQHARFM